VAGTDFGEKGIDFDGAQFGPVVRDKDAGIEEAVVD
jgi:hypothetical protein